MGKSIKKKKKLEELLLVSPIKMLFVNLVSEEGMGLVEYILQKKKINEFKAADKLGLRVNDIRSYLYKLYSKKIVSYTRVRDKDKGWYVYTWTLNTKKIIDIILDEHYSRIRRLNSDLIVEQSKEEQYYLSENCGEEYDFSKAMEMVFTCENCGDKLKPLDNQTIISSIRQEIKSLKEEISVVEEAFEGHLGKK